MSAPQPTLALPQQRQFDKLAREVDNREYNKALRTADAILGLVPDHAETMAMKGLTLYNLEHKEEAYELIKRAIMLYPGSAIAWHSLGICQRTDKNYVEALKAFKRALLADPKNANILRDISTVCIQLRDWEQFLEVRQKMVTLKASIRANWVALSCAHRMLGQPKLAAAVMDTMTAIMDAGDAPAERSEAQLYRVELALESQAPQRALELLKQHDADILDAQTKLQLRARAHAQLGQKAEAEKRYMELLAMGVAEADAVAMIAQLRRIALDEYLRPRHDTARYMELLEQVIQTCPRSEYARRHRLDCVPLENFESYLAPYAAGYVRRLVPSLFTVLKSLYQDPARVRVIEALFLHWEHELREGRAGCITDAEQDEKEQAKADQLVATKPNPCFLLWVWTYLATHYRRTGQYELAQRYIDQAIAHTPTLELLYTEKAKICARAGDTAEAARLADFARSLDLQDKYLNSKAAKYLFRNNDIEGGERVMQLFYSSSIVPGDTYLTALESQCVWYEREVGEAYYRRGDYISALQNLLMFELHHRHNHYELSDFHNYVFRRNTMRSWFNVIACDDDMARNRFFFPFATAIVRTYLKVHELGEAAVRAAHVPRPEPCLDGLSSENVKRLTQLRKDYYIETVDLAEPLQKAERYMRVLLMHRANDVNTQRLAVEYYTALQKPLLVARALYALQKLGCDTSELVAAFDSGLYAARRPTLDFRVVDIVDELMHLTKTQRAHSSSSYV